MPLDAGDERGSHSGCPKRGPSPCPHHLRSAPRPARSMRPSSVAQRTIPLSRWIVDENGKMRRGDGADDPWRGSYVGGCEGDRTRRAEHRWSRDHIFSSCDPFGCALPARAIRSPTPARWTTPSASKAKPSSPGWKRGLMNEVALGALKFYHHVSCGIEQMFSIAHRIHQCERAQATRVQIIGLCRAQ